MVVSYFTRSACTIREDRSFLTRFYLSGTPIFDGNKGDLKNASCKFSSTESTDTVIKIVLKIVVYKVTAVSSKSFRQFGRRKRKRKLKLQGHSPDGENKRSDTDEIRTRAGRAQ